MSEKSSHSSVPRSAAIEGEIVAPGTRGRSSYSYRSFKLTPLKGIFILLALLFVAGTILVLIIKGGGFLVNLVLPVVETLAVLYLVFSILILLPMAIFRQTRPAAAAALYLGAGIYGLTAWMIGFVSTLHYFGVFWVIVGVLLAGIGVVPLGMLATLFNADMGAFWSLLGLSALAFGSRAFGRYLAVRSR